jgi:hypothetical protein
MADDTIVRSYVKMEKAHMGRLSTFMELMEFLKRRRKWWLTPIIILVVLLGVLIVLTEGTAVAPFIYALF